MSLASSLNYLILLESEVINPFGWDKLIHEKFDRVYTWNDSLVDNIKYFKINFSHKFPESRKWYRSQLISFENKKLCTLISGNKIVKHKYELYSERIKTIRWFEEHAIDDFDLYGIGWDKYISENRYTRFLVSRMGKFGKLFFTGFSSYKGMVDSKFDTLSNYKFSICYENAQMIPGYITEKIFDCFFAGCVPVYWGASNIIDHIPKDCFIDRRLFDSHDALYRYLTAMTVQDYLAIQKNIENYLFSESADPYRAETFANTITEHILNDQ
ncbi:glycosyltransferase family 10 [Vibrio sp. SA48]